MPKANILRQTPSTSNRQQVVQKRTQPTILARAPKTAVTSTIVKMEPSCESETVIVDNNYTVESYTPHGPTHMHNYSIARSNFMLDKTPQVGFLAYVFLVLQTLIQTSIIFADLARKPINCPVCM